MVATKEQERKALEKIRKIVAELGEDSYLATAFEGCFDDAEANINEDAAYSYKGRYESAEVAYNECFNDLQELRKELERANAQIEEQKARISKLNARIIPGDDMACMCGLVKDRILDCETNRAKAAERIVDLAENPQDKEFRLAVATHKQAKADITYCQELLRRVDQAYRA